MDSAVTPSPQAAFKMRNKDPATKSPPPEYQSLELVTVNMTGTRFEITSDLFNKILTISGLKPHQLVKIGKEYYFNRNVSCFRMILDYFLHDELHLPEDVCPNVFQRELEFWGLGETRMSDCCHRKMVSYQDDQTMLIAFNKTVISNDENLSAINGSYYSRVKWNLWCILDKPSTSKWAKAYLVLSIIFVIMSLFVMAAGTHQTFQRQLQDDEFDYLYEFKFGKPPPAHFTPPPKRRRDAPFPITPIDSSTNDSNVDGPPPLPGGQPGPGPQDGAIEQPLEDEDDEDDDDETVNKIDQASARLDFLNYMEYAAMAFFSLELVLRLVTCPNKLGYFKNVVNILDMIALVAMYTKLLVDLLLPSERYSLGFTDFIECLQTFRVFRFFRIVKDVIGLRVLMYTIRTSTKELCLLVMYLMLCVVILSGIVYYCERDNMRSIPDAMYWVVVTMTTVGYGDMAPKSYLGKTISCVAAILGVLLIAVTIPVFVNNFILFYSYSKTLEVDKMAAAKQQLKDVKLIKIKPQPSSNVKDNVA